MHLQGEDEGGTQSTHLASYIQTIRQGTFIGFMTIFISWEVALMMDKGPFTIKEEYPHGAIEIKNPKLVMCLRFTENA